jgi:hypothetical protein
MSASSKAHDKKGKAYAIHNEKHFGSTHNAFEGWSMFKVLKPSMWYWDDNCWEAG